LKKAQEEKPKGPERTKAPKRLKARVKKQWVVLNVLSIFKTMVLNLLPSNMITRCSITRARPFCDDFFNPWV
jgi:hypothetical protein